MAFLRRLSPLRSLQIHLEPPNPTSSLHALALYDTLFPYHSDLLAITWASRLCLSPICTRLCPTCPLGPSVRLIEYRKLRIAPLPQQRLHFPALHQRSNQLQVFRSICRLQDYLHRSLHLGGPGILLQGRSMLTWATNRRRRTSSATKYLQIIRMMVILFYTDGALPRQSVKKSGWGPPRRIQNVPK